jgi:hypothetical protein
MKRVWGFLEKLLELHLITIETEDGDEQKENGDKDDEEKKQSAQEGS